MLRILAVIGLAIVMFAAGFVVGRRYEREQQNHINLQIDENGFHLDGSGERR